VIEIRMTTLTVAFDGEHLTIDRHRPTRYLPAARKTIPIGQISGVQWKPAGRLTVGWLRITIPGTIETRSRHQEKDALRDENTITFKTAKQAEFDQLRKAIEDAISHRGGTARGTSVADQLTQLAALHQTGALTDTEYEQAKSRILRA
jgi:hypothetical protein